MRKVIAEEIVKRKRLGLSIIVWRDGKVVEVPPEEIPEDGGLAAAEEADRLAGMPWAVNG